MSCVILQAEQRLCFFQCPDNVNTISLVSKSKICWFVFDLVGNTEDIFSCCETQFEPTFTVTTPLLPTFFMASEIRFPIELSPLADIVATWNSNHQ